ncbi:MAG: zinc-dependent metalloprotease [Parvularculaceae bacterium]
MKNYLFLVVCMLMTACAPDDAGAPPRVLSESVDPAGGIFFPIEVGDDGKAYVTMPKAGDDGVSLRAIHSAGLTAGLGSNPVGLDRGFADEGRIIAFRRVGDKLVIEQENWRYQASADNPLEKRSVMQSFAPSFLWAGDIDADAVSADGSYRADISGFLTADLLDVTGALRQRGQGDYSRDGTRSFVKDDGVLEFPDNVEVDAYLTFTGAKPGGEVLQTAADGRSFTLVAHHSFVRLPDDGFQTRDFDERSGAIDVPYYDFSASLDEPVQRRFARRFRLERADPRSAIGPVKKPIVFYVDSGAPEPVRSALVEGASWWAEAFRAAGFEDAYRVEVLPEGAHPLDVRYNTIQWVHRQTRGWSYGGGVFDPRTGEMLKANVILGSQRVRQDRMIFEGLAGAAKSGSGEADDPVQLALARIRQLAAHEVGHTLGFAHNFAASTNNRASVMDYPAPYVRANADRSLNFSGAYDVGIGEWDIAATKWLYAQFPEGADEKKELNEIIMAAYNSGLRFIDDPQGRPTSGAHPFASVWDNGSDPVATLRETMLVREIALSNFGLRSLKNGAPTNDLNMVIVPIYLYHRYQTAAAAKLVGGYDFRYAVKGDGGAMGGPVDGARQRDALAALADTLSPAALDLSDETLNLLNPRYQSFFGGGGAETFASDAAPMFSLQSSVDAAASQTLGALLDPARAARLIEMERRDPQTLSFDEVLRTLDAKVFATPAPGRQAEIARTVQARYVTKLIELAGTGSTPVAARVEGYLKRSRLLPGCL